MSHNPPKENEPNNTKLRGLTVALRQLGNYLGDQCVLTQMRHHNVIIKVLGIQNLGDHAIINIEFMNGERQELRQNLVTFVEQFIFERICVRAFGQEVKLAGIFDGYGLSVDGRSITHDALLFEGWQLEV